MWARLKTNEQGTLGTLDIYVNEDGQGLHVYAWEWQVNRVRNTGGMWHWSFERALGGLRYVINLQESRSRSTFAKLTHGRINFYDEGPQPKQPWFVSTDHGNGIFPPSGPQPHRMTSGFVWSVLLAR